MKHFNSLITSIYPRSKLDIDNLQITIDRKTYPINPTHKWLATSEASVRDTMFSIDAFKEANAHALVPRDQIASDLMEWATDPSTPRTALFSENTGTGKSKSIVDLFNTLEGQIIYCAHTKDARDAFVDRCDADVRVVQSTTEIIDRHVTTSMIKIDKARDEFYKKRNKNKELSDGLLGENDLKTETHFDACLDHLVDQKLINETERTNIQRDHRHSQYLLTTTHKLAITARKFEYLATYNSDDSPLRSVPVIFDEPEHAQVTDVDGIVSIYSNDRWEIRPTDYRVRRASLLDYRVCFVTAERFLEHELEANQVEFKRIGRHCKILEDGLEIVRVKSTASGDKRNEIVEMVKRRNPRTLVLANSVDGADSNFVRAKGSNDLREVEEIVVILSYPPATQIGRIMLSCNVSEADAVRIVMSDMANQMIGRNLGYRNTGNNRCLLVIPAKADVETDMVTTKLTSVSAWDGCKKENRERFHFKSLISDLTGFIDYEALIYQHLLDEKTRGQKIIPLKKIGEHFELSDKTVGRYLASLDISTVRKQVFKSRVRAVNLEKLN